MKTKKQRIIVLTIAAIIGLSGYGIIFYYYDYKLVLAIVAIAMAHNLEKHFGE